MKQCDYFGVKLVNFLSKGPCYKRPLFPGIKVEVSVLS